MTEYSAENYWVILLSRRKRRLERLIELMAPEYVIENERELVAQAERALETLHRLKSDRWSQMAGHHDEIDS